MQILLPGQPPTVLRADPAPAGLWTSQPSGLLVPNGNSLGLVRTGGVTVPTVILSGQNQVHPSQAAPDICDGGTSLDLQEVLDRLDDCIGRQNLPDIITLHPLDGNIYRSIAIYDISYSPKRLVGTQIYSYNYLPSTTNVNFGASDSVPALIPLSWTALTHLFPGLTAACPFCPAALYIWSAISALNNMVTIDAEGPNGKYLPATDFSDLDPMQRMGEFRISDFSIYQIEIEPTIADGP